LEYPFIFEVDATQTEDLEFFVEIGSPNSYLLCVLTVPFLSGEPYLFMNVVDTLCTDITPGTDGRTRFTFSGRSGPDRFLAISMTDPNDLSFGDFGFTGAYNPATDRKVEIEDISGKFYPEVLVDTTNRLLTFTYSSSEGGGIYYWVKAVVEGTNDQRGVDVIRLDAAGAEVERDNYSGCFPVRYEILDGFGLDTTLRARVVLSYNVHQPG